MKEKLEIKNLDDLFEAVLCLETVEECRSFFKDLCTIPELKALSQRFQVAKLLTESHVYSDIVAETGASTATISRVNRSISYDGSGGYSVVFERLKDKKRSAD
ncbi:MAG: YerC/YecD family TrpR-related protein [Oscillospiraceae bacterium]